MIGSRLALAGLVGSVLVLGACDPQLDPVSTRIPPRSSDEAELRVLTVPSDSVEIASYRSDADVSRSDRLFAGEWEGIEGSTFLRFDLAEFEADADSTIESAEVALRFVAIQGDSVPPPTLEVAAVVSGDMGAWAEDSLSAFPGPDVLASTIAETMLDSIPSELGEFILDVDPSVVAQWLADPDGQNGLRIRGAGSSLMQIASAENFQFEVEDGVTIEVSQGPRLLYRVAGSDSTRFSEIPVDDAYVLSADMAMLPCADPADCISISQGTNERMIVRPIVDRLPPGANVHRATIDLTVLGHPRFDRDLDIEVFRITSEWPGSAASDSLVETSGIVWHETELSVDSSRVEVVITDLVQAWEEEIYENRGIMLRTGRQADGVTAVSFASSTHPDTALRPRVTITYTVPFGGRP